MGDRLSETIRTATSGPVIIGAASFWYSITGWEESLFMRDGSASNLRSRPTRGWGNNQGLSSLSCKLSTGLTRGDRAKKPQDGFRVLGVHWMEIWVLSFQCNPHSDTVQYSTVDHPSKNIDAFWVLWSVLVVMGLRLSGSTVMRIQLRVSAVMRIRLSLPSCYGTMLKRTSCCGNTLKRTQRA